MISSMSKHTVFCGNPDCHERIDEPPDLPADERLPCPKCGSKSRLHVPEVNETIEINEHAEAVVFRLADSFSPKQRRDLYSRRPWIKWAARTSAAVPFGISAVTGDWLGVVIGVVFGTLAPWLLDKFPEKGRQASSNSDSD
jgi:hypothetical protein